MSDTAITKKDVVIKLKTKKYVNMCVRVCVCVVVECECMSVCSGCGECECVFSTKLKNNFYNKENKLFGFFPGTDKELEKITFCYILLYQIEFISLNFDHRQHNQSLIVLL